MKHFFPLALFIAILTAQMASAQNGNLLCVRNSSALGGYAYATLDLVNDTVIDHTLLPGYLSNIHVSTTTDTIHSIYYVCDGMRLFGVNTITDSLVLNMVLPLSGMNSLTCIQYNNCDSSIYGVIVDVTTDVASSVSKFNPQDSTVTLLATLTGTYHSGAQGAIDPANNVYLFELGDANSSTVGGFDIALNQLSFLTPVSPLDPSILFRGISYDCANARVVGLEIRQSATEIYFSSVDVLNGTLTAVSASPIANIQYFTAGGACLDHTNGTYYYTRTQNVVTGFDGSGNLAGTDTVQAGAVFGIETMTACPCPISLSVGEPATEPVRVYPNPANGIVNIELQADDEAEIMLYNSIGQLLYSSQVISKMVTFDFSCYDPGVYFFIVRSAAQTQEVTLVKEY